MMVLFPRPFLMFMQTHRALPNPTASGSIGTGDARGDKQNERETEKMEPIYTHGVGDGQDERDDEQHDA